MAAIYPPIFTAENANGDPVSGAGLWVFETGTTTPAAIFTNKGLTAPAANPLEALSDGRFPQFYIASGAVVDLQCRRTTDLTSSLLWGAEAVDALGAESLSTFYKDFGPNGRLQARGAGGVVRFEFGKASGVSLPTVHRIETGGAFYSSTGDKIAATFEAHGVEILNGDSPGARLKPTV